LPVFFAAFRFFCILPFCQFLQRFVAFVTFTAFSRALLPGLCAAYTRFSVPRLLCGNFVVFSEAAGS